MLKCYNYNLAIRFASDFKYPISVFTEPEFEYELNLYEPFYGCLTKWNNLIDNIEKYYDGNPDVFVSKYYDARENIIQSVLNSEEYKAFNSIKMPQVQKLDTVSTKSVYNHEFVGKHFISIDMKNANFQVLQLNNVINPKLSYKQFIDKYAEGFLAEYIAESKYSRQVIFGKLNPSRQITFEKYFMSKFYQEVVANVISDAVIAYNGSDEIILIYDGTLSDKQKQDIVMSAPFNVSINDYILYGYEFFTIKPDSTEHKIGEFFKRSCDEDGKYKSIPLQYHKILIKKLHGLPVEDMDKIIMYDKCRVMILDDIIIKQIENN